MDGCQFHDNCLNCPYPKCKEDVPWEVFRKWIHNDDKARKQKIESLHHQGHTIVDIAKMMGVSRQTVHKILREGDSVNYPH